MASSFVPTPLSRGRADTSGRSATPTNAPLPSAQVASYANQQVGQLNAGLGASIISSSPTQLALSNAPKAQNAVQLSAQKRMDSVKASGQRLTQLAQATAAKRTAKQGVSAAPSGAPGGMGQAWRPDGSLSASRNKVLSAASSYIGSPYQLGGTTTKGIDCSGLVKMVYAQLGYNLAHYVPTQAAQIGGVKTSVNNLRPGDLVVWADGSHIAIYAGNGEIIEAQLGARSGPGTRRAKLYSNYGPVYGIALRLPGE